MGGPIGLPSDKPGVGGLFYFTLPQFD